MAAGVLALTVACPALAQIGREAPSAIARVKESVVAVGSFAANRQPQFRFHGSGFVVGNGAMVATNAHVLPRPGADSGEGERLAVMVPGRKPAEQVVRTAKLRAVDSERDLAVIDIDGPPLPALKLGDSDTVRDGANYVFTGFPVGGALGLVPVTHRAFVGAVTPIVIAAATAGQLSARAVRQIQSGAFDIFQLDAVAYPGNSGSPLYDAVTGEVVGVVNMTVAQDTKESALPRPTGIAFAIPARWLKALLDGAGTPSR